jgi:hypothetical protein
MLVFEGQLPPARPYGQAGQSVVEGSMTNSLGNAKILFNIGMRGNLRCRLRNQSSRLRSGERITSEEVKPGHD